MKLSQYFYLFIFLPLFCISQNIRHLSVNEGLPQSFVSHLVEDDDGFIWMGTRNGLTRFDGHEFITLQHIPGDENSLASNIVYKLQKGENNSLWVLYETKEIDLVSLDTGKVNHVYNINDYTAYGSIIDKENNLWYISENKTIFSFKLNDINESNKIFKYTFENDIVWSMFFDKKGNLWVLSQKGLHKFNKKTKKFDLVSNPFVMSFDENYVYDLRVYDGVSDLHERVNGEFIWSDKQHLYIFNPNKKTFRRVELPRSLDEGHIQIQICPNKKVYFIINDEIYSYDDKLGIVLKGQIPSNEHKLNRDKFEIHDFLIDQSGLIWVSANTDGVYQIDFNIDFKTFSYNDDFAVNVFEKQFNISLKDYFNFDINREGTLLPAYYLRSVKNDGKIWIALNRTVAYYDIDQKELTKLQEIPILNTEDFVPLKGLTINSEGIPLVIDQNSNLYSFNTKNSKWEIRQSSKLLQEKFKNKINPTGLLEKDNLLWIVTEFNGLICIDEKATKLINFNKNSTENNLPTNNLINIISDENNEQIFWIASYYGLLKFNKDTYESNLFSINDGLPDNTIYTILSDDKDCLWLGTNKGLCKFNTKTFNSRTYTLSHGLSFMEYNRYHQLELPNGDFVFGGLNDGVIFSPLKMKEDLFNPAIGITRIKINNDNYKSENESFLLYNNIKEIKLPHHKNNISIEFSGLEFSQPEDISYKYRLKGYDDNWVILNEKREAVYTKIPYGDYIFQISATNTSGTWSDKIKTLSIHISPPWWSTIWAIFIYIILSITTVYFIINRSIRQKIIKKEIEFQRKEANHFREINEIKTKFFTNMTHELRTPLSLIIAPVEQLKKTKEKKHRKRLLKIIKRNANNLLNLSDQLLDVAKLEAGVLKPNYLQGDIILSIKKSIEAFKEEAKEKAIKIDLISPLSAKYIFSPYLLERIINNLVSNSIKYGVEGGRIEINLIESKEGLILKIEDNGKGISQKDLPHVFERFYQVDLSNNKTNATGSGIGLSLVYELVKLQNGEIDIESRTGANSGTILTIQLPYKKIESLTNTKIDSENQELSILNNDKDLPTVLIVEDNKEMLDFLSISLSPYYRIIISDNAAKGLKLAQEIIPEIIISDIMMANMNGLELCKKLKDSIITNHIPIILLTAKTEFKSRLEGLTLGADDYMTKPFNVSELLLRIKNRIEIQEKQRETIYEELKLLPSASQETIQKEKKDDFLIRIDEILNEHLDNEQFGVNDLALSLNMSRTSLHRKIKALTNTSTGKIIQIYRLKRASTFLKEGYNISEVSYKTGFGSPSYFTKCFKETYGLTPSEYIEKKT